MYALHSSRSATEFFQHKGPSNRTSVSDRAEMGQKPPDPTHGKYENMREHDEDLSDLEVDRTLATGSY